MQYEIYGPFEIEQSDQRLIPSRRRDHRAFWERVEEEEPGLSDACGCYVFGVRAGGGIRVWYVGQAQKQPFGIECLSASKINAYNEAVFETDKGTPVLFLLPRLTPKGRFCRTTNSHGGHTDIGFLEDYLLASALRTNPRLKNIKGTKYLQSLHVAGLINPKPGKPGNSAILLRDALDLT
jgi:hypothetical protein